MAAEDGVCEAGVCECEEEAVLRLSEKEEYGENKIPSLQEGNRANLLE